MKTLVTFLAMFLLLGSITSISAQNAEKILQQGMMKEEAEGNLTEAIEIYSKLVDDSSVERSIRANALLHVGICHEKLGQQNALNAYQKIISEYSDQTAIATLARKKLQSLKGNTNTKLNTGLISERLEKNTNKDYWYRQFSPDGRYYIYTNSENNTEELMICDIQTGKRDSLTTGNRTGYGFDNTQPWGAKWSPDGKKIAYNWGFWSNNSTAKGWEIREIRLIDKNGTNEQVILSGTEGKIPDLEGFTHDSKNLLGTLYIQENEEKTQQLGIISITNKNFEVIKNFGKRYASHFSFSPDGKYLLYDKTNLNSVNTDIFVMSITDMQETQITNGKGNYWQPKWSPDGDQILFLSDGIGNKDLCKIDFKKGKPVGEQQTVLNNIGDRPRLMGITSEGSVFYENTDTRNDVFTLDLDEKFNNGVFKVTQITNPALKSGGSLAKYSKDGRYISFLGNTNNSKNEPVDLYLGDKYYINIYDTKTKTSKLLNLDLYFNHESYKYLYHIPSWSYYENKLLIHGKIKENYEGGFFTVDVLTEKVTPVLTVKDCKYGTDYKRFGNSMVFSKSSKDKIYYSSPDWKDLMEYNMVTHEEKSLFHMKDWGFWFDGFLDDAETKFIASNKNGTFSIDINTNETIKMSERDMGSFIGTSQDKKYNYYIAMNSESLKRIQVGGSKPDQEILFDEYFPNASYRKMAMDLHPNKNEILLSVRVSSGTEIFKLTNVFD